MRASPCRADLYEDIMVLHNVLLGSALLVTALVASKGGSSVQVSEPSETVEKLIEQLGDDSPKVREEATRKLVERNDALPALKKALESPDAEVRERAKLIIAEIEKRRRQRAIQRVFDSGLDLYIDQLVARGKQADDADWSLVLDLAHALADKAGKQNDRFFNVLNHDFFSDPEYKFEATEDWSSEYKSIPRKRLLAKRIVGDYKVVWSIVLCRSALEFELMIVHSIVFVNGDIKGNKRPIDHISNAVVFSDGDVHVGVIDDSVVIATGRVTAKRIGGSSVVIERDRKLVDLFNPATAGIEVADSKTEAKVEKVHADKPFAKAGFQKGDLVLAVGDKEIKGYDDFRKAVRRNFVDKTEPVFKVKRGEQTLELKVSFKE